jgi:hypothetical protein
MRLIKGKILTEKRLKELIGTGRPVYVTLKHPKHDSEEWVHGLAVISMLNDRGVYLKPSDQWGKHNTISRTIFYEFGSKGGKCRQVRRSPHKFDKWNGWALTIYAVKEIEEPQDEVLADALRDALSPEAVAAVAAYLVAAPIKDVKINTEIRWFANRLIKLLGKDEYARMLEELDL